MIPNADGPDIAHYQTLTGPLAPEWKLASVKCSEGSYSGDKTFPTMWKWAEPARWRGAYHWLRSDSSIKSQADNIVNRTKAVGFGIGDFIQTDWETTPNIPNMTVAQVEEFNDRVRQLTGRDCVMTYVSDWVPGFASWRQRNPDDPLWYANYNTSNKSTGGWAECALYRANVWQWTSSYLHPSIGNGLAGFDMNHIFDTATLDRICGLTNEPQPPQPPTYEDDMKSLIPAQRIYDSRNGGPKTNHSVDIYANKVGVTVQVITPATGGYGTVWGAGQKPSTSNLQYNAGESVASYVPVTVEQSTGRLYVALSSPAHVIIDLLESI